MPTWLEVQALSMGEKNTHFYDLINSRRLLHMKVHVTPDDCYYATPSKTPTVVDELMHHELENFSLGLYIG
jgi:hypothetical protein